MKNRESTLNDLGTGNLDNGYSYFSSTCGEA
jgi:hypothetical protein